jgi:hypothetical protein
MGDNPCVLIAIEEASVKEEQRNESRDPKLPGLENEIAVPHVMIKLFLSPIQFEEGFIPRLINNPVEIIQPP